MRHTILLALTGLTLAAAVPAGADAAVIINIVQSGSDVVTSFSGSINMATLGVIQTNVVNGVGFRSKTFFYGGATNGYVTAYRGFSGPTSIGSVTQFFAPTSTWGSQFAINGNYGGVGIFLDPNYVSNAALAGGSLFAGKSLASLGLSVGEFAYTSANDTITVRTSIAPSAVPEPATWAMFIGGFGIVGGALRRRSQAKVHFA
jgi:hypothetical protein